MNKKRILAFILALLIFSSISNIDIYAASTRKVTTTANSYNDSKSSKKAPKIKKGKTIVTNKGNQSKTYVVKFTAPKTKTYKISLSNVRNSKDKDGINGHFYISKLNEYGYYNHLKLKTNGGKSSIFQIGDKQWCSSWGHPEKKKVDGYYANRYINVKLKKGETIYISTFFVTDKDAGNTKYDINIKSIK